jgi:hypothetical protein
MLTTQEYETLKAKLTAETAWVEASKRSFT